MSIRRCVVGLVVSVSASAPLAARTPDIEFFEAQIRPVGHASIQQTQRFLNVTDEELRRGSEVSWENQGRSLRLASGS